MFDISDVYGGSWDVGCSLSAYQERVRVPLIPPSPFALSPPPPPLFLSFLTPQPSLAPSNIHYRRLRCREELPAAAVLRQCLQRVVHLDHRCVLTAPAPPGAHSPAAAQLPVSLSFFVFSVACMRRRRDWCSESLRLFCCSVRNM
jgi:hypothetical protein